MRALIISCALLFSGCASTKATTEPDPAPAPAAAKPEPTPADKPAPAPAPEAPSGPIQMPIAKIATAKVSRPIRVVAFVVALRALKLVPPQTIFEIKDGTGQMTAMLAERKQFAVGAKVELVGKYQMVPSPLSPAREKIPMFVVERYLEE